ncbi:MAG: hypothetical protein EOO04_10030 [Chitinophagaceae bacterium]|nr:MAG: hypothetical protein EOO04_10030 [Chitinophagaceae bacterium]
MKKMILIVALGGFSWTVNGQTNQTYRTDMQNARIYTEDRGGNAVNMDYGNVRLNTGTNNQEDPENVPDVLSINSIDEFQGHRLSVSDEASEMPAYQQGRNAEVQRNIELNTRLMNLPSRGEELPETTAVRVNTVQQFQGNRMGSTTSGRTAIQQNRANAARSNIKINSIQQFQGNSLNSNTQRLNSGMFESLEPRANQVPFYDTSKNNGHCLGCGSGTLTDPHPWLNR